MLVGVVVQVTVTITTTSSTTTAAAAAIFTIMEVMVLKSHYRKRLLLFWAEEGIGTAPLVST